jgi:hypothetical protein
MSFDKLLMMVSPAVHVTSWSARCHEGTAQQALQPGRAGLLSDNKTVLYIISLLPTGCRLRSGYMVPSTVLPAAARPVLTSSFPAD